VPSRHLTSPVGWRTGNPALGTLAARNAAAQNRDMGEKAGPADGRIREDLAVARARNTRQEGRLTDRVRPPADLTCLRLPTTIGARNRSIYLCHGTGVCPYAVIELSWGRGAP